jgi:hypothetical protein
LFIEGQKVSYTNIMAEQFKAVGGGEFKIPFMADNIGGFKINGTVVRATIGSVRRRCPDSSFRNSFNRDFNPAVAAAGPIITVALQVLKAIICCRQHTVAQQVFL